MIGSNLAADMIAKIAPRSKKLIAVIIHGGRRPLVELLERYNVSGVDIDEVGRALGRLKGEDEERDGGWIRWKEGKGVVKVRAHAPPLGNKRPAHETPGNENPAIPRLPIADYPLRFVYILPITDTDPQFSSGLSLHFAHAMRIGDRGYEDRPPLKIERWGKRQENDYTIPHYVLHVNVSTVYDEKLAKLPALVRRKAGLELARLAGCRRCEVTIVNKRPRR